MGAPDVRYAWTRTVRIPTPNHSGQRRRPRESFITPRDNAREAAVGDLRNRRDRDLLEAVGAGDEDAFGELFRRYGGVAKGLAYRILREDGLAEEVVQEVFLSVWRRATAYDQARGTARSWILGQIHHRSVDVVRREEAERRRLAEQAAPMRPDEIDDVIEDAWIAERSARVRSALSQLPGEQRELIELAYYAGLTQTQIAGQRGLALGTVKSRTFAAMKALRTRLGGEF